MTQIRQKEETVKVSLKDKVRESETAVAYDKKCLENDKQEQMKKAHYLTQFRDGNKQVNIYGKYRLLVSVLPTINDLLFHSFVRFSNVPDYSTCELVVAYTLLSNPTQEYSRQNRT